MATLGLLCPDSEQRRRLALAAGECGHVIAAASDVAEAIELLRERGPRLWLVVESPTLDAAVASRELLRAAPLLPVVAVLAERDAARAVELLRSGAAEVVGPPWTRDAIEATLSRALRFPGTAVSVIARPPSRARPAFLLAALLFFGAAFAHVAAQRRVRLAAEAAARVDHWDLPYKHPAALAFDGRDLWIADWFTQSFYVHEREGLALRRLVHFPAETPVALSFTPEAAWSVSAGGSISKRLRDGELREIERYADAAPDTIGLAFDGLYLWTCDNRQRRLHKRLLDSKLTILASFGYSGARPAALVFDGDSLWSLDAANHELVRHNLERPDEATGRVGLREYRDGRYRPVGAIWDGERFWTLGEKLPAGAGPARLFRHAPMQELGAAGRGAR